MGKRNCSRELAEKLKRKRSSVFWDITPCSPLEVNRRFGGILRFHLQGRILSQARNQHKVGSKQERWNGDFQWTSWRYIPEDRNLHNLRCENFISYLKEKFNLGTGGVSWGR
jgi:hypothetical protein